MHCAGTPSLASQRSLKYIANTVDAATMQPALRIISTTPAVSLMYTQAKRLSIPAANTNAKAIQSLFRSFIIYANS